MKKSDEQLIFDYLDGDERAMGILVDKYVVDVFNFSFRLTNDKQAAEDITQESFIKAWKNIRKFGQKSSFRTWLFSITRNTTIDWLRQKRDVAFSKFETKEGNNILLETVADEALLPDELLARAEDIQFIETLLSELNPAYREVLELKFSSGLTFKEIGEILKKPIHTIKSQHHRAIIALRRSLQSRPI